MHDVIFFCSFGVMAYDKEVVFPMIISHIEDGESLRAVLRMDNMPNRSTFFEWLKEDKEKSNQYARACEYRADTIFEDILTIADDSNDDFQLTDIGDGVTVEKFNPEHVQRSRLRVDSRKWILSKMNPKKYGDRIQNEHSGEIKTTIISLGNGTKPDEANT